MEEERLRKLKEASERKAARAAAERALQEEHARKEREEKLEEEKIQAEMVALRRRIREEQQEKLAMYEKKKEEQTEAHKAELAAEYRQVVMRNAEEEVKRKRILGTRHVLLKQLQEAERREIKERYAVKRGDKGGAGRLDEVFNTDCILLAPPSSKSLRL